MQINAITLAQPKMATFGNKKDKQVQKRSIATKKWGVGIASFLMPGLGQFANGQTKKGFKYLGINIGLGIVGIFTSLNKKVRNSKVGTIISGAVGIVSLVNIICSIVNAVKNVDDSKTK